MIGEAGDLLGNPATVPLHEKMIDVLNENCWVEYQGTACEVSMPLAHEPSRPVCW